MLSRILLEPGSYSLVLQKQTGSPIHTRLEPSLKPSSPRTEAPDPVREASWVGPRATASAGSAFRQERL